MGGSVPHGRGRGRSTARRLDHQKEAEMWGEHFSSMTLSLSHIQRLLWGQLRWKCRAVPLLSLLPQFTVVTQAKPPRQRSRLYPARPGAGTPWSVERPGVPTAVHVPSRQHLFNSPGAKCTAEGQRGFPTTALGAQR
jgi:hypothetical protein